MGNFENTLKHYLKTLWNTQFENHWNLWEIFEDTLKHIIWKHFETHNMKTIETYGEFWKHFETHNLKIIETYGRFLNTLWNTFWKHTIWKPLKPMGNFENTLKHIIWKHFETYGRFLKTLWNIIWKHSETHNLKTIETYEEFWKHFETYNLKTLWNLWKIFENTLKHIIWKHFETHHLKIIETYEEFWKHFETYGKFLKTLWNTLFENTLKHTIWKPYWYPTELSPLRCDVTTETLGFQLALKWNTYVQSCMERKSAFFTLLKV